MPGSLAEALDALADQSSLTVLAGGTDLLVELNYGRSRPDGVLSLRRVPELRGWRVEGDEVVLGAATTYTELLEPGLARLMPALAQSARTVGSPQIRNTGTIGGNLGTASPAGDTLPVLAALDARVEVASASGWRTLPVVDLIVGPKRTALQPGELITTVRVPVAGGPQEFLKVGVRNAMVIAIANCALVVDVGRRTVGCALGAVGPVPIRDPEAERWLADQLDWDALADRAPPGNGGDAGPRVTAAGGASPAPLGVGPERRHGTSADDSPMGRDVVAPGEADALPGPQAPQAAVDDDVIREFGRRMAAASRPIDDHRSPAGYRRHAIEVLTRRALHRVATSTPQLATGRSGALDALKSSHTVSGSAVSGAAAAGIDSTGAAGEVVVNGVPRLVEGVHESDSLLRVLRDELGMPGTKNACEQGECGSCSVLVDGVLVCACLELATATAGCEITTVEGLAGLGARPGDTGTGASTSGGTTGAGGAAPAEPYASAAAAEPGEGLLTDVQRAMVEAGGVQCGFCTPGLVVAIHDLLDHVPTPSPLEVREALAGNLCRCTGYGRILDAVEQVVALRITTGDRQ